MFRLLQFLFLIFTLLGCSKSTANSETLITITRQNSSLVRVSWSMNKPVNKIIFVRSFSSSDREKYWTFTDDDFKLGFDEKSGKEFVTHVDGKSFTSFEIMTSEKYTHIEGEYAPFFPYESGGIGIFLGRYLVCTDSCSANASHKFNIIASEDEVIISKAGYSAEKHTVLTNDNIGSFVYIGPELGRIDYIIDHALSDVFTKELEATIDGSREYFSKKFGFHTNPQIFLSTSLSDTGRFGHQGGVIDNQIYYHWYGKKPTMIPNSDSSENRSLSSFIIREIAHLYQKGFYYDDFPLVHEGMAEFMAWDYLNNYKKQTSEGLVDETNVTHCRTIDSEDFQQNYVCGLVFYKFILSLDNDYPYEIWNKILIEKKETTLASFIEHLRSSLSTTHFELVKTKFPWLG